MGVIVIEKYQLMKQKEKEKKGNLRRRRSRLLLAPAHFDNLVRGS